jgi:hypothetical protein
VTCRVTPGRNPNRRTETVETSSSHNTGVRYTNCDRFRILERDWVLVPTAANKIHVAEIPTAADSL